ncbi:hypothetical protein ADUPG1_012927 [Aduncisulcus paluster]|nr:hypothetical protein ADUPG1_012927 [Aduncisulcus paluster]
MAGISIGSAISSTISNEDLDGEIRRSPHFLVATRGLSPADRSLILSVWRVELSGKPESQQREMLGRIPQTVLGVLELIDRTTTEEEISKRVLISFPIPLKLVPHYSELESYLEVKVQALLREMTSDVDEAR